MAQGPIPRKALRSDLPRRQNGHILSALSDAAQAQILRFIKFFSAKREHVLQVLDGDWDDAVDLLHEEMYAREEVVRELQQLRNVVSGAVRTEHQTIVNMVVLLLKQIFEEVRHPIDGGVRQTHIQIWLTRLYIFDK